MTSRSDALFSQNILSERRLTRAQTDYEKLLVRVVETSTHCGRLAAAVRCLLEADPSNRLVVEALAEAALECFDDWQKQNEFSTGPAVHVLGDGDGRARKDGV